MNTKLIIRAFALTAIIIAGSACTTVEQREPSTSSTTVTEESSTHVRPLHGASATQTTTTYR